MKAPDNTISGQRGRRREDLRLTTGRGRFVTDITPNACLHVAFVRSPHACADILETDSDAAAAVDGVAAVLTGADVAALGELPVNPLVSTLRVPPFPVLAHGRVQAVGQPVVAVVAESLAAATEGGDLVEVEYDPLDPVLAGDTPGTRALFAQVPDNLAAAAQWTSPDAAKGSANGSHMVAAEIRHARLAPTALEPRAAVAEVDGEHLTLWLPSQSPQRARTDLAHILGIDADTIRVIAPDVGGAFGMKASLYPEDVMVAWLALRLGRPVKWVASRSEEFLSATQGRGMIARGRLSMSGDGRFMALEAEVAAPLGHWLPFSAVVPARNAGRILPGPYVVGDVDVSARAHVSNTAAVGIYRGAGRPEAAVLMERLVDLAADKLGIDGIELRRRNLVPDDAFPYRTPTGQTLDQGHYRRLLDRLEALAGAPAPNVRPGPETGSARLTGFGMAFYVEPSGQGWETARVELHEDGRVIAATGSSAQGQGRETATARIVGDALEVEADRVAVRLGDTDEVPEATGALASRSTPIGGSALLQAAQDVRARRDAGESYPIIADVTYEAVDEAWGYGCAAARVSILKDTGEVRVDQLCWVDDCGRVIDEIMVEGQLRGGIAQGLGEALMEQVIYDADGQLLTGSLMDYALPRAADMPPIIFDRLETPSPHNLIGARGVGEAGTIGAPAAVLNAVLDALKPFGVEHLDMPLTSEKIWRAINGLPPRDLAGEG